LASLELDTGVHEPTVLLLNLEGRFPDVAALYELVIEVGRGVKLGRFGPAIFVVATPQAEYAETIRSLGRAFDLPIFLTESVDQIEKAQPVKPLTPTESATLDAIWKLGGRVTVASLADVLGVDHTAAGNRAANLEKEHLVFRIERPQRFGHLYVDPRVAVPLREPADPTLPDFALSHDLKSDVRALAEMQGREPASVIADALRDFMAKHKDQVSSAYDEARQLVQRNDEESLGKLSDRHSASRRRPHRAR
jgi:hypothetical protein